MTKGEERIVQKQGIEKGTENKREQVTNGKSYGIGIKTGSFFICFLSRDRGLIYDLDFAF